MLAASWHQVSISISVEQRWWAPNSWPSKSAPGGWGFLQKIHTSSQMGACYILPSSSLQIWHISEPSPRSLWGMFIPCPRSVPQHFSLAHSRVPYPVFLSCPPPPQLACRGLSHLMKCKLLMMSPLSQLHSSSRMKLSLLGVACKAYHNLFSLLPSQTRATHPPPTDAYNSLNRWQCWGICALILLLFLLLAHPALLCLSNP